MICLSIGANAQKHLLHSRSLTIEDGLSSNKILSFHQDRQGLIWIGTKNGLNRFDGYEFKWWNEANGLQGNSIHDILEDGLGRLWILERPAGYDVTVDKIDIMNPITGQIQTFEETFGNDAPIHPGKILNHFSGPHHDFYFYTRDSLLWRYESETGFQQILLPPNFSPFKFQAPDLILGIPHPDTTAVFSIEKNKIISAKHSRLFSAIRRTPAHEKDLWFFDFFPEKRYSKFDPVTGLSHTYQLPLDFNCRGVKVIASPDQQTVWLLSLTELIIANTEGELLFRYDLLKNGVTKSNARSILLDRNGLAWVGTEDGIVLLEYTPNQFKHFLHRSSDQKSEEELTSCRGIAKVGPHLFVNTYRGRYRINTKTNETTLLPNNLKYLIDQDRRLPLHLDHQGRLWSGARDLVLETDPKTGKELNYIPYQGEGRSWSIYYDQSNVLWVGNLRGLYYQDPELSDSLVQWKPTRHWDKLENALVNQITEDATGIRWVVTSNGLYSINQQKELLNYYGKDASGKNYLPTDFFQHFYRDKSGIIWLGTESNGLIRWDQQAGSYQEFSIGEGLANNNIYAIYEDDYEQLWMSSDYGIIRLDKNNFHVRNYGPEDGITHQEFNRMAHFQDKDGNIYFGGLDGVTAFHPKDFRENQSFQQGTPLVVTELSQLTGKAATFKDRTSELFYHPKIRVGYNDRLFTLKLSNLDYFYANKTKYFFKIDELSPHWNLALNNQISLNGLSYGEHTLRLKSRGADGQASAEELVIPLSLATPPYLRLDIQLLLLLAAGLAIWGFIRYRTITHRHQQALLEEQVRQRTAQVCHDKEIIEQQAAALMELDEIKSRFFADASHELQTPLRLILNPIQQLLQHAKLDHNSNRQLRTAEQHTRNLLQQVGSILDLSQLESGRIQLQPQTVCLTSLLERIINGFRGQASLQGVSIQFKNETDTSIEAFVDPIALEKILNNLISNALTYTPNGGTIRIRLSLLSSYLLLHVADTGTGIPEEDLPYIFDRFYQSQHQGARIMGSTGIGLALCRELTQLMGGTILVESELGQGSRFTLRFRKDQLGVSLPSSTNSSKPNTTSKPFSEQ